MSIETYPNRPRNNGKATAGIILLLVGLVLLVNQFHFFFFPGWLFSWPVFLIMIGFYSGAKNNYKNSTWLILVIIGSIFLFDRIFDGFDLRQYLFPLGFIVLGLWFILRRNQHGRNRAERWQAYKEDPYTKGFEVDYTVKEGGESTDADATSTESFSTPPPQADDFIDSVTVFGNVKKVVLSKNFRGGDIVNIFGGSELDFSQADINGRVILDVTQLFGGVKLIVPPHWQVTSDLAAIFGGIDDKRFNKAIPQNADKVLVLKGTSIFAGIDIRSF
ncbi:hypothetical protein KHS38_05795 [Mucilaginibacter sp. Bleaf8]|uniref:LiaF transmembrane domain-containing protein n=1 Tax=Mucilaginibacter sp. Bleaf8 TaxID=2834430 RepID=UPI001BD1B841|nr:DUF5668 domain-containing protein [Mucilaginibacter sp. Bleaf8]MBS7563911.1 hypothetical protein [Mucilaginibacter sp. Bleaf8]